MARISDVPQPIDPRDPKRVESRRDADTSETKSSGASGATGADRVAISSDARESEALRDRLTQAAANTPDVREDKVAEIKERIANGEFDANSDQIKRAVADAMLDQLGL